MTKYPERKTVKENIRESSFQKHHIPRKSNIIGVFLSLYHTTLSANGSLDPNLVKKQDANK